MQMKIVKKNNARESGCLNKVKKKKWQLWDPRHRK